MPHVSYNVAQAKIDGLSDDEIVAALVERDGMTERDARAYLAAYAAGEAPWRDDFPEVAGADEWKLYSRVEQPEVA